MKAGQELASKVLAKLKVAMDTSPLTAPVRRGRAPSVRGQAPISLLLLSDGLALTSDQQYAPFVRHARRLRDQMGVVVTLADLASVLQGNRCLQGHDLVGLKMSFRTPAAEALRITRQLGAAVRERRARWVYFDGDDDLNVQWPEVLDEVDVYVKKHRHADPAGYRRAYVGKSNLTDHVARVHGWSFLQDAIPATAPLTLEQIGKLHLGWNIALDDKIQGLLAVLPVIKPGASRRLDVSCRAAVPKSVWTHPLRESLIRALEPAPADLKVIVPRDRVSQDVYYQEMLESRICVSPFGYGELCWRDFEAIACGCLLVKPDMSHVSTWPNLFEEGVTYAPVRWDYADVIEVCRRYLRDDAARQRIVETAQARLMEALSWEAFAGAVDDLLRSCGWEYRRREADRPV